MRGDCSPSWTGVFAHILASIRFKQEAKKSDENFTASVTTAHTSTDGITSLHDPLVVLFFATRTIYLGMYFLVSHVVAGYLCESLIFCV